MFCLVFTAKAWWIFYKEMVQQVHSCTRQFLEQFQSPRVGTLVHNPFQSNPVLNTDPSISNRKITDLKTSTKSTNFGSDLSTRCSTPSKTVWRISPVFPIQVSSSQSCSGFIHLPDNCACKKKVSWGLQNYSQNEIGWIPRGISFRRRRRTWHFSSPWVNFSNFLTRRSGNINNFVFNPSLHRQ